MRAMTTTDLSADRQEQKKRLLRAKIAVALHDELGRVPKTEEIDQAFTLARVLYKAVLQPFPLTAGSSYTSDVRTCFPG